MAPSKKKQEEMPGEIAKLSFEEAYSRLKQATERLENDEVDLESMLKEYATASALAKHCANLLQEAEERIKVLIENEGEITLGDLESPDRQE